VTRGAGGNLRVGHAARAPGAPAPLPAGAARHPRAPRPFDIRVGAGLPAGARGRRVLAISSRWACPIRGLLPTRAAVARIFAARCARGRGRTGLDLRRPARPASLAHRRRGRLLRSRRGIPAVADNVLITRGSQMGLDLVARWLVRPGDNRRRRAARLSPGVGRAFEEAGARPPGRSGRRQRGWSSTRCPTLRACSTPPPPPSVSDDGAPVAGAAESPCSRRARRDRFAILEDDYDHEFHFEGRPVRSARRHRSRRQTCSTWARCRRSSRPACGSALSSAPRRARSISWRGLRTAVDRQGDQILEAAVAELIEDGELQRHARKMCRIYESRAAMPSCRRSGREPAERPELHPATGRPHPVGPRRRHHRARGLAHPARSAPRRGVLDRPRSSRSTVGRGRSSAWRFARHDEAELGDAIRRLAAAPLDDR